MLLQTIYNICFWRFYECNVWKVSVVNVYLIDFDSYDTSVQYSGGQTYQTAGYQGNQDYQAGVSSGYPASSAPSSYQTQSTYGGYQQPTTGSYPTSDTSSGYQTSAPPSYQSGGYTNTTASFGSGPGYQHTPESAYQPQGKRLYN